MKINSVLEVLEYIRMYKDFRRSMHPRERVMGDNICSIAIALAKEADQQAAEIERMKEHIKREESLGEDFARKYKQQAAVIERLKEWNNQLKDAILSDPPKIVKKLVADKAAEIERLKEKNERWRILLFRTAEKYVSDVLNADGDVILELLEKALKGQDNETI